MGKISNDFFEKLFDPKILKKMELECERVQLASDCYATRFKKGPGSIKNMISNGKGIVVIVMLDEIFVGINQIWRFLTRIPYPVKQFLFCSDGALVVGVHGQLQKWDLVNFTMVWTIDIPIVRCYYHLLEDVTEGNILVTFTPFNNFLRVDGLTGQIVFEHITFFNQRHFLFLDKQSRYWGVDGMNIFTPRGRDLLIPNMMIEEALFSYRHHFLFIAFYDANITAHHDQRYRIQCRNEDTSIWTTTSQVQFETMILCWQEQYLACKFSDRIQVFDAHHGTILFTRYNLPHFVCQSSICFSDDGYQIKYHSLAMICAVDLFPHSKQAIWSLCYNHLQTSRWMYKRLSSLLFVF